MSSAHATRGSPAQHEHCRVLLVGASPEGATRLKRLLASGGQSSLELARAERLTAGVQRLAEGGFDAVLLDLSFSGSRSVADCLSQLGQGLCVPIIVLSALDDESLALEAVRLGAQDYLVKNELDAARLARAIRCAVQRHRLQSRLQTLTLLDELTGLYNRRGFLWLADQQLRLARRSGRSLTIVFGDLDDLKLINDTYGHTVGDEALLRSAEVLRSCFRDSDILARFGGDEFTMLLVDTGRHYAETINDRIRDAFDRYSRMRHLPYRLSMSAGAALCEPDRIACVEEMLALADSSLYQSKRARVYAAS